MLGDACDLPPLGQFGCLFFSNILCTVKDPHKVLRDTHKFVVPGGTLVMAENYMRHGEAAEVGKPLHRLSLIKLGCHCKLSVCMIMRFRQNYC